MTTNDYLKVTTDELLNLPNQNITVVIKNTSLSKYKTINLISEAPLSLNEENSNDSLMLDNTSLQVCLQPFLINCEGVPYTSEAFVFDTSKSYRITLNGVDTVVHGATLYDYFSRNNISMREVIETT